MGSFSVFHWLILIVVLVIFIGLPILVAKMISKSIENNSQNPKKQLGVGFGILCFLFPFIGIILGLMRLQKPYGKSALLLGGLGIGVGVLFNILGSMN
ncbi:hypothetical protein [Ignatzschineria sp. LJL83]